RLQRMALATPTSVWQAVGDRLAVRLRLRRHVHVAESSGVEVPSVIGWWRPVLLLPLTGLAGLTPSQAEAIVAHELVHVRRHDYLVNVLQRVTETVLFYHPGVWWVSHRMRVEREHCCDAVVVGTCGNAADYATALLRLEETRGADLPRLAVAASGGVLLNRIRRILNPPPDDGRSLAPAVVTAATVLLFVLIASGSYRASLRTLEARGHTKGAAVIATVNGEPVTQADVDHFRPLHGEPATTPLARVLVELIDERLLVQHGHALGFRTEPGELRVALAAVKDHNHIASDAALDAQLAKSHLTRADLEQHLLRSRVVFHLERADVRNGLLVSDDEARRYFDTHLDEFPLQTFDLAKPALVNRLTLENLGRGIVPASYIQPLRAAATIVWTNVELQRAYTTGLRAQAPVGTPVPGRLTTPAPDWHMVATEHFDIYAPADLVVQFDRVQRAAERAYQHVSTDLRHDLGDRPTLVLFATAAAARAANSAPLPGGATRTLLPVDQPDDVFQATVTHEVAHLFASDIVPRQTYAITPTWMIEGLSEYEGGVWATSDRAILRDLVRTNAVPALSTLDTHLAQDNPRLPYSLGHAAFDFIASRWGADGVRRLLLALRNGNVDRQTLYTTALGVSADDVDGAFDAYLRAQFPERAAAVSPELPKCLRDAAPTNVDLTNVTIPDALTLLGGACGISVRVEGIPEREASRVVPRVQFSQARPSEIFRFLITSASWRYTVVDDTTLVLTRQ
ncbi:MAG TPA: M56 family metallopeptidase, partial [Vicinamibacterales bacterium]|nr:M56 family metallopeptidase [Vicinamibacterales bacterium]